MRFVIDGFPVVSLPDGVGGNVWNHDGHECREIDSEPLDQVGRFAVPAFKLSERQWMEFERCRGFCAGLGMSPFNSQT